MAVVDERNRREPDRSKVDAQQTEFFRSGLVDRPANWRKATG